jgi:hypothetical protein
VGYDYIGVDDIIYEHSTATPRKHLYGGWGIPGGINAAARSVLVILVAGKRTERLVDGAAVQ